MRKRSRRPNPADDSSDRYCLDYKCSTKHSPKRWSRNLVPYISPPTCTKPTNHKKRQLAAIPHLLPHHQTISTHTSIDLAARPRHLLQEEEASLDQTELDSLLQRSSSWAFYHLSCHQRVACQHYRAEEGEFHRLTHQGVLRPTCHQREASRKLGLAAERRSLETPRSRADGVSALLTGKETRSKIVSSFLYIYIWRGRKFRDIIFILALHWERLRGFLLFLFWDLI